MAVVEWIRFFIVIAFLLFGMSIFFYVDESTDGAAAFGNFWRIPFPVCVRSDADCSDGGYAWDRTLFNGAYDCERLGCDDSEDGVSHCFFVVRFSSIFPYDCAFGVCDRCNAA